MAHNHAVFLLFQVILYQMLSSIVTTVRLLQQQYCTIIAFLSNFGINLAVTEVI
jgi:hypothetical protein